MVIDPSAHALARPWVHTLRASTVAALVMLGSVAGAEASNFSIDRTRIDLSKGHTSELVTLQNQSSEPLRLQVTGFKWTQQAGEPMVLEPTEDIVYFPTVLLLEPGASRQVRVGYVGGPSARERAYRIILEELPPATAAGGNVVRVLTRLNVPVFVDADRPSPVPVLGSLAREGATLVVPVHNQGSTHVMAESVSVAGVDERGRALFTEEVAGWYVLADSANTFYVALPPACGEAAAFQVTVRTSGRTLRGVLARGHGSCK